MFLYLLQAADCAQTLIYSPLLEKHLAWKPKTPDALLTRTALIQC